LAVAWVVGLGLLGVSSPPVIQASGGVWFLVPPMPQVPEYSEGMLMHLSFSVRGRDDALDTGNANVHVFDAASGKLAAVLSAVKQGDGRRVWEVFVDDGGIRFWVQFEPTRGSVPAMLLLPWTWWVYDGGHVDQVAIHGLGPWEVLKGNVVVHGI
jgi:hypothetical protein